MEPWQRWRTRPQIAQDVNLHYYETGWICRSERVTSRKDDAPTLTDELFFQRAVQTYLWALPALNMYGMKEGSEKVFGRATTCCQSSSRGSMPRR